METEMNEIVFFLYIYTIVITMNYPFYIHSPSIT